LKIILTLECKNVKSLSRMKKINIETFYALIALLYEDGFRKRYTFCTKIPTKLGIYEKIFFITF